MEIQRARVPYESGLAWSQMTSTNQIAVKA